MTSQPNTVASSAPGLAPVDTTPLCDGRFVPFRRLGSGSQGETFEAVDRATGRAVALKRFDVHGASSWKDVELAEREARVLQTLNHPALPAYVLHFEHAGALYLAMEKIDGENLAQSIAAGKRFAFDELLCLLETLADVFAYLHGQLPPIVHRDIKPSNLIKRDDGRYALIDFGSVRDGLRPQGGSTVVGTFGYMAPEQFQGRALPATDLYGTGATLLSLLTGTTPDRLPHRGLEIDVRAALPASTPKPWLDLLERLTSADPDRRSVDLHTLLPALRQGTQSSEQRAKTDNFTPSAKDLNAPAPEWLKDNSFPLPFPLLVLLQVLRVVLYLALQVALPLVLTLLSVIFGRGLRQAARDVSDAGETANRQLMRLLEQSSPKSRAEWTRKMWDGPHAPSTPRRNTGFDGSRKPSTASPRKRRIRVGDFDVELPADSSPDDSRESPRVRKK